MKKIITLLTLIVICIISTLTYSCSEDPVYENPFDPDYDRTPLEVGIVYVLNSYEKGAEVTIRTEIKAIDELTKLAKVSFFNDDQLIGESFEIPFSKNWNTKECSVGTHNLKIIAEDLQGYTSVDSFDVTLVRNHLSIKITSPTANDSFDQNSVVILTAKPETGTYNSVEKMMFYVDDALIRTDTTSPYSHEWNSGDTEAGQHTVKAVVLDNFGNTAEDSVIFNLVENP